MKINVRRLSRIARHQTHVSSGHGRELSVRVVGGCDLRAVSSRPDSAERASPRQCPPRRCVAHQGRGESCEARGSTSRLTGDASSTLRAVCARSSATHQSLACRSRERTRDRCCKGEPYRKLTLYGILTGGWRVTCAPVDLRQDNGQSALRNAAEDRASAHQWRDTPDCHPRRPLSSG